MQEYQLRVIEEKATLDDKIEKLDAFIQSPKFKSLPKDEQERLVKQSYYMCGYSEILDERITCFK